MTTAIERAPKADLAAQEITPLSLIQDALHKNVAPEVLKELVSLQQSMVRFSWEAEERKAKIDFDTALNQCQAQIGRVAPNVHRENNIWWADYAHLDRTIRPVYIEAGFSIGFSEAEGKDANRLRMRATVSRGGVSREYFAEISRTPASSKMSQADADASAASRVKRYLILDIFNIAIGIDKDEKLAIAEPERVMTEEKAKEWCDLLNNMTEDDFGACLQKAHTEALGLADLRSDLEIQEFALAHCPGLSLLKTIFRVSYDQWKQSDYPNAVKRITAAYEDRKKHFGGGK